MSIIEQAWLALKGHFPTQHKYFWFKGQRIQKSDFDKLVNDV